jgi:hypothetical protein
MTPFSCPHCEALLSADDIPEPDHPRCPACGGPLELPASPAGPAPFAITRGPAARLQLTSLPRAPGRGTLVAGADLARPLVTWRRLALLVLVVALAGMWFLHTLRLQRMRQEALMAQAEAARAAAEEQRLAAIRQGLRADPGGAVQGPADDLREQLRQAREEIARLREELVRARRVPRVPAGKAVWQWLHKGMDEEEVRHLLGQPNGIRVEDAAVRWYYGRSGQRPWVEFLDNRVLDWEEPEGE